MNKKLGLFVLSLILSFGALMPAYAAEADTETETEVVEYADDGISPRYKNISSIGYSFIIDDDGEASYSANVITYEYSDIEIYVELQKKSGSSWKKLYSSTGTKSNIKKYTYGDSYSVDDINAEYRVYYKITTEYGNNQTESTTNYKYWN
ncbi:hypothetical protein MUJ63_03180 [Lachnospiraceae bacterium NSJ-143]|nr:hypothetical protein [Lachnospiraceae bacterium NSJ-143]